MLPHTKSGIVLGLPFSTAQYPTCRHQGPTLSLTSEHLIAQHVKTFCYQLRPLAFALDDQTMVLHSGPLHIPIEFPFLF